MIDTIVLRINNLSKYSKIYEQFYKPSKKKGDITIAVVDENTGEISERAKTSAYIYHDTNRVLPLTYRSTFNIASSHYTLSYSLNNSNDFLEFNFSVPKYLFGTNLFQFVNNFSQDSDLTFKSLILFLKKFFKENFLEMPIFEDVEIHRIDCCYNQFFNSKNDALHYLDLQKELLVKYARSSRNNFRSYDTSLMYITKRYSFKIYHKGTEFRKHDYNSILKAGNPFNYPLSEFLEKSDCILRYEMTFRKSYINYLFRHYFFNSVSLSEHPAYEGHIMAKFGKLLSTINQPVTNYRDKHENALEFYNKFSKSFRLASPFDYSRNILSLQNCNFVTFDCTLFRICYSTFWKMVLSYQLDFSVDAGSLIQRIKENNNKIALKNSLRRKKVNEKDNRLLYAALLSNFMNIDEFKTFLPLRTFQRLKSELKEIGIIGTSKLHGIPRPGLDYVDYFVSFGNYHNLYL